MNWAAKNSLVQTLQRSHYGVFSKWTPLWLCSLTSKSPWIGISARYHAENACGSGGTLFFPFLQGLFWVTLNCKLLQWKHLTKTFQAIPPFAALISWMPNDLKWLQSSCPCVRLAFGQYQSNKKWQSTLFSTVPLPTPLVFTQEKLNSWCGLCVLSPEKLANSPSFWQLPRFLNTHAFVTSALAC